ncbi:hypothetical protein FB451DRAFT_1171039 [Mycena latifolia]|nr:hypothetical protein FB451DRAFT_1171039 [Mycena latifolia]
MSATSKLFQPLQVGNAALQHRVILAPLTRYKASEEHVSFLPLVAEYYGQRASKAGTLLITEATFIAARAGGYSHVPGIWSPAQIAAWKKVTATVHAKGSFIFMQLWALGRAANYAQLQSEDPLFPYVSASAVPLTGRSGPLRALTVPEIKEYVALYAQAAKNAIEAGCDGVEIHGANGYLVDQFLQDISNKRTDEYGGSIENRARFALEVIEAVVPLAQRERLSVSVHGAAFKVPLSVTSAGDMGMPDPLPTFSHVISQLAARHPTLAYIHLVEPRINGSATREAGTVGAHESNDALRALWAPRPFIRAGGFTRADALEAAESGSLVAFGRFYISNPDLPARLEQDVPLTAYDRSTFYLVGQDDPRGYTDYPFATAAA